MTSKQNRIIGFYIVAITTIMIACAGVHYPLPEVTNNAMITNEYSVKEKTEVGKQSIFVQPVFIVDKAISFSTPDNRIIKITPHNESWKIIKD